MDLAGISFIPRQNLDPHKRHAMRLVVLFGVVSLLADVTYEGARSVTGPFLGLLGASGTAVGVTVGLGELVGYGLRYVSGVVSDRTHQYWTLTIVGYVVNLLAVPLLALTGRWELAALLIVLERTGKAVRTPARNAMLSHASQAIGRGWGFGLHEAMDQTGALLGPLIVAGVLARQGRYQPAFAWLAVPAVLALVTLAVTRRAYPEPMGLELPPPLQDTGATRRSFWLYTIAGGLIALGYADYPLIAFHMVRVDSIPTTLVPVVYALAMVADAVSALFFGKLFDRQGTTAIALGILLGAAFAPLVFLGRGGVAVLGAAVWGIGLGVQESILRAGVSRFAPPDRRASVYGLFDTIFGVSWFLGSATIGFLYDHSLSALVTFAVVAQLMAVPCMLVVIRTVRARAGARRDGAGVTRL